MLPSDLTGGLLFIWICVNLWVTIYIKVNIGIINGINEDGIGEVFFVKEL
jgi:hypothetical protein